MASLETWPVKCKICRFGSKVLSLRISINDPAFLFLLEQPMMTLTADEFLFFFFFYIEKRVVDFLLVLIELFSLGVTAEVLQAKIDRKSAISLQRSQFDLKFQVFLY